MSREVLIRPHDMVGNITQGNVVSLKTFCLEKISLAFGRVVLEREIDVLYTGFELRIKIKDSIGEINEISISK